jgi:DNA replication and repair protein RecF
VPITRISLTRFRSYADAVLEVPPRSVVLHGANGAGKTNVLEALSLFAPGRGLRGATLEDMARQGSAAHAQDGGQNKGWGVAIKLDDVLLGTGVTAESPQRRTVRAQGVAAAIASLPQYLALLWLTPAQDRLFLEGATERRRFLDRLVLALYPDHAGHVARYEHAQRERLKLLTDTRPADPAWLAALETRIAEHGVAACAARADAVAALQPLIDAQTDSPFPKAQVGLSCAIAARLAQAPALAAEEWLGQELAARRADDARTGRTGSGPGRSDLVVVHAPKQQPAAMCSTGEQKALLLGLVLAQAQLVEVRTRKKPFILLDEVAAHLDSDRRSGLFTLLENMGVQAWLTGTDRALFSALETRASFVSVEAGQLVLEK